jgi:predicted CoA-substrate-specific enzyme activase
MTAHYLGIDLGSAYTKFVVLDHARAIAHAEVIPTLSRRHEVHERCTALIHERFDIRRTCATGYGRRNVSSDLQKTELICAAAGVSMLHPMRKCILDIGGEDIKIIESGPDGSVLDFHMSNKCAAGTGAFISEIAERAELQLFEMSRLAKESKSDRTINSFCTVFAKSEILSWKFDGVPPEDIARGIYLSVVDRVRKLPIKPGIPLLLCGGVIAYHPLLAELLAERVASLVHVVERPQLAVALGAAVLAHKEAAQGGEDCPVGKLRDSGERGG